MLCIRPAVCIRNEILCIRPAVCRHTEAMHTAGLYLTLTITRPYANFSSLLYFMAIALNRSFCFSTVRESNLHSTFCTIEANY